VLALSGANVYIAGDTALFDDMRRIGQETYAGRRGIDLAILPIGDRYTMGPDDAVEAVELLAPRHAAPSHYNTWPPIAQDAAKWAEQVRARTQATPHTPAPGGSIRL
jgi:L-ascorbate metabolism protein UlaG (beta-lactamase superfamily)